MTEGEIDLLHLRGVSAAGRGWDEVLKKVHDPATGIAWVQIPYDKRNLPLIVRLKRFAGTRTIHRADGTSFYRVFCETLINGPLFEVLAPQTAACDAYCLILGEGRFAARTRNLTR